MLRCLVHVWSTMSVAPSTLFSPHPKRYTYTNDTTYNCCSYNKQSLSAEVLENHRYKGSIFYRELKPMHYDWTSCFDSFQLCFAFCFWYQQVSNNLCECFSTFYFYLGVWVCGHNPGQPQVHGQGLRPGDRGAGLWRGLLRRLPARRHWRGCLRLCAARHEGQFVILIEVYMGLLFLSLDSTSAMLPAWSLWAFIN